MEDYLKIKKDALIEYFRNLGSAAVAFSAGVDSTLLLTLAFEALGDRAVAITAVCPSFPEREALEAKRFCEERGIRHIVLSFDQFAVEGFRLNPVNRCYLCKKELFTLVKKTARENSCEYVAEGSNTDDLSDYRPGMRAIEELGVKSPFLDLSMSKADIRALSAQMNLPTFNKPSFACLATRFVYGEEITEEKLEAVEKAEQELIDRGFSHVRVRVHGDIARIEVEKSDIPALVKIADEINEKFTSLGFAYTTLDLGGYRLGSMNRF
jgi:uncharacterized protein